MPIYGWDASHYDAVPNVPKLLAEGFSFMTHKLGGDGNDAEAAATWAAVKPHRATQILRDHDGNEFFADAAGGRAVMPGAYWIVRPDLHGDPVADADTFIARLNSQMPGWNDGMFILQADCESWGDASGRKKPNRAHIQAFGNRLVARAPKLMPAIYASAGDYGDGLTGLTYPLWNARYVLSYQTGTAAGLYTRCGGDAGKGWNSYSGQTPAIWQFTSSATIAGQSTCDANAYRGTLADLVSLVAPGWQEVPDVNLTDKYGDEAWPARTVQNRFRDDAMLRDVLWGDPQGTKVADLDPHSPLAKLLSLSDRLAALEAKVGEIGTVAVSPQQLQAALVAALEQLAGASPAGA